MRPRAVAARAARAVARIASITVSHPTPATAATGTAAAALARARGNTVAWVRRHLSGRRPCQFILDAQRNHAASRRGTANRTQGNRHRHITVVSAHGVRGPRIRRAAFARQGQRRLLVIPHVDDLASLLQRQPPHPASVGRRGPHDGHARRKPARRPDERRARHEAVGVPVHRRGAAAVAVGRREHRRGSTQVASIATA